MPQISVIVPVYQVEKYIHRCVDSILSQTFSDFELILVDDGSPDRCGAICDEYAVRDNRVTVIHQENAGVSAARNAGIDWAFEKSDSEWIYFADSDDWIHRRTLETLLSGAKSTGLDVVIGGFQRTKGSEAAIEEQQFKTEAWKTEKLFFEKSVTATTAWGTLYRKRLFADLRYPVGKNREDEWVTYKVLFQNARTAFVDAPLYSYFRNPNGIMGSQKQEDYLSGLDAQKERIDFFRAQRYRELCVWEWYNYQKTLKKYVLNAEKYGFSPAQVDELRFRISNLKKEASFWERVKDMCFFCKACLHKVWSQF